MQQKKYQIFQEIPTFIFLLSLLSICISFHGRLYFSPDTSLTFDHWWYFVYRLQNNQLAQWNPYYMLGKIAVHWNHVPVNIFTPILYFTNFTLKVFHLIEMLFTFLYLISIYFSARILGLNSIISMLILSILSYTGFRYWIAHPTSAYFLLPISIALTISYIRESNFRVTHWVTCTSLLSLSFLGVRLESFMHFFVFATIMIISWTIFHRNRKVKQVIFFTLMSIFFILALNAWQLDLLIFSSIENSRFQQNAAQILNGFPLFFSNVKWIGISILYQPLLIMMALNALILFANRNLGLRKVELSHGQIAIFICAQTLFYYFAILLPSVLSESVHISLFLVDSRIGNFESQKLVGIPIAMGIFYWQKALQSDITVSEALKGSILYFFIMSITQYSWQEWPINQNMQYFFMAPILNCFVPLGAENTIKRWGYWLLFGLFAFHFVGESLCFPLFDYLNIPWNPSRAALIEAPIQIILIGEALNSIVILAGRILHTNRWKAPLPSLPIKFALNIAAVLLCSMLISNGLMPRSKGFYEEQFPFAKTRINDSHFQQTKWMDEAYRQSLYLSEKVSKEAQTDRMHVPDDTWQNYPNMRYDFMPSRSLTLNTAPAYSSEIPYHLKLMLKGPQFIKSSTPPPHPEMNPLVAVKRQLELNKKGTGIDLFNYLDQVLLLPHEIMGYPAMQLLAETNSGEKRVSIRNTINVYASDEEEYQVIKKEFEKTNRLPNFVTTVSKYAPAPSRQPTETKPFESTWKILDDKPEYIKIEASVSSEAYLILLDQFENYGWQAKISNSKESKKVPIIRAFLGARALALPQGKSSVEFFYQVPGINLFLSISLAAGIILFLLNFFVLLEKIQKIKEG